MGVSIVAVVAGFQAESNQVPQGGAKVHSAVIQEQGQIGGHLVDLLNHLIGHSGSDLLHSGPRFMPDANLDGARGTRHCQVG